MIDPSSVGGCEGAKRPHRREPRLGFTSRVLTAEAEDQSFWEEGTGLTKTGPAFFDGLPLANAAARRKGLAVRQLELDAPVLGMSLVGIARIERAAVAEAGRDQVLLGHSL